MTDLLWFLTRSSGVVALVLIVAAIADGLLFSGRETGRRLRPAWWMDLHRGLGGYALVFTGLHLATAYGADMGVGLAEIFVPGAAAWSTGAFTWGVVGFYLLAVTVCSSWPKRFLRRRTWHLVHLLSIPAAVAAGVHAYQLGSDALTPWFVGVLLVSIAVTTYPLALRLSGIGRRRQQRLVVAGSPHPDLPVLDGGLDSLPIDVATVHSVHSVHTVHTVPEEVLV